MSSVQSGAANDTSHFSTPTLEENSPNSESDNRFRAALKVDDSDCSSTLSTEMCTWSLLERQVFVNFQDLYDEGKVDSFRESYLSIAFEARHHCELDFKAVGFKSLDEFVDNLAGFMIDKYFESNGEIHLKLKNRVLKKLIRKRYKELKQGPEPSLVIGRRNKLKGLLSDELMGPNDSIPVQALPPGTKKGEFLHVIVSNVISPGDFHIQLRANAYNKLLKLMDELEDFYCSPDSFHLAINYWRLDMPNLVVAAPFIDEKNISSGWHRAVVMELLGYDKVKLFYPDYGTEDEMSLEHCRFLHKRFQHLPFQAIKAKMVGLVPYERGHKWSTASAKELRQIAMNVDQMNGGFVAVVEEMCKEVLELELYDTVTNFFPAGIKITDVLVQKKLALRKEDLSEINKNKLGSKREAESDPKKPEYKLAIEDDDEEMIGEKMKMVFEWWSNCKNNDFFGKVECDGE